MSDLNTCVMCGSKHQDLMGYDYHKVSCSNKECPISCLALTKEEWNQRAQPTITDYLDANEAMLTKTKAKMVTIESLRKFAGIN